MKNINVEKVVLKLKQDTVDGKNIFKPHCGLTERYFKDCLSGLEKPGQLNQEEFNQLDGPDFKDQLLIETF